MRTLIKKPSVRAALLATALALSLQSTEALSADMIVGQTNLVTDNAAFLASQGFAPAATVDPDLRNPWGMSFGPTTPFWISNQVTGNTTLYNGAGAKQALTVTIPGTAFPPSGPTGQRFNPTSSFNLSNGSPALFLFANLDGSISGWNPGAGTTALIAVPSPNAAGAPPTSVYTGLALGNNGSGNFIYAANNAQGRVDVFSSTFAPTILAGNFTDPTLPAGLAPFNIANIGGQLFVTFARPGPTADEAPLGLGVVDIFDTNGNFVRRFAEGGNLLSPWGITQAPSTFGEFANAILVGNFAEEDGFINAFALNDGTYLGMLSTGDDPFRMPYLWDLGFRTGGVGTNPNALYFTAGIGDEQHGLFAQLTPVPEPSTWLLMLLGFGAIGLTFRSRTKLRTA